MGRGCESLPGLPGSSRNPLGINPSPRPSAGPPLISDAIWGVSAAGRVTELGPLAPVDPSAGPPRNTPTQETTADRPRPTVLLSGSGFQFCGATGLAGVGWGA